LKHIHLSLPFAGNLGHKEINGPIYYSLPIIKCPKSTLQEFQDGIGVVNEGVLSKKKHPNCCQGQKHHAGF
jgi:hypothetical protein